VHFFTGRFFLDRDSGRLIFTGRFFLDRDSGRLIGYLWSGRWPQIMKLPKSGWTEDENAALIFIYGDRVKGS
jgi:hypothetical protein